MGENTFTDKTGVRLSWEIIGNSENGHLKENINTMSTNDEIRKAYDT